MKYFRLIGLALLLVGLGACSSAPTSPGQTQRGQASYYADKYQSRTTASGERFDQNAKTAAHRSLPFGARVEVTHLANGRSVVVRINDRGPFVRGRIIDLSRSAFAEIGDTNRGVIDVKIEVLD